MRPTSLMRRMAAKPYDPSKRLFMKTAAAASVGILALGSSACNKPDVDFYVATVSGTLEELKPLIPTQSALLNKGISIAKSFNDAYQDGKFDNAMELFENLVGVVNEVIAVAGIEANDSVKIALAVAGVGVRGIAVLLKHNAEQPAVASVVKRRSIGSPSTAKRASLVESLADSKEIDAVLQASKPQ